MTEYSNRKNLDPQKSKILKDCAKAVRKLVASAEVIVYGSVARGEEQPDSDIDLLVLVPSEVSPCLERAIKEKLYEIELRNEFIITSIIRQRAKWHSEPLNFTPLYHSIEKEGVRL